MCVIIAAAAAQFSLRCFNVMRWIASPWANDIISSYRKFRRMAYIRSEVEITIDREKKIKSVGQFPKGKNCWWPPKREDLQRFCLELSIITIVLTVVFWYCHRRRRLFYFYTDDWPFKSRNNVQLDISKAVKTCCFWKCRRFFFRESRHVLKFSKLNRWKIE